MINEFIETFKNFIEDKGDKLFIDLFTLKGTYVLVKKDFSYNIYIPNEDNKDELYYYFAEREYNSLLIQMNKSVDSTKKIHSCNYLSFFIKKINLSGNLEKSFDSFYSTLKYPEKKYRQEKLKMYLEIKKEIGDTNVEKIEKIEEFLKKELKNISNLANIKKDNEYLKIFFEEDIEEYKKEYKRYLFTTIFAKAEESIEIDGDIAGIPTENMNYNEKKPYLENKTRKFNKPIYLSLNEAYERKQAFDFLTMLITKGYIYIYFNEDGISYFKREIFTNREFFKNEFSGYFIKIGMTTSGAQIEEYSSIPRINLNKTIELQDVLSDKALDKKIYEKMELIDFFDILNGFFDKKLYRLLDDPENMIKYSCDDKKVMYELYELLKKILLLGTADLRDTAELFFNIAEYSVMNISSNYKAKFFYNLAYNLKYNKNLYNNVVENEEIISKNKEIADKFKKIFKTHDGEIDNDEEYFFALGQLIKFLISRNEIPSKTPELTSRIFKNQNIIGLKKEVYFLFRKSLHEIGIYRSQFNILYERILGYVSESQKVNREMLLGSYLYKSIIYEKISKENDEIISEDNN